MNWKDSSFITSTPVNKASRLKNKFVDEYCMIPSPITSEIDSRCGSKDKLKSSKKLPPSDNIREGFLNGNEVDETIFISDDEDPVVEIPRKDNKFTVDDEIIKSLGEKFRKSLGGMGKEKIKTSQKVNVPSSKIVVSESGAPFKNDSHSNRINLDNNRGKFLPQNSLNKNDNEHKSNVVGGTKKINNGHIDDATRSLKRRSPPPTFNTPDRPKEKPMAAFRKMQRAGPTLCSPQPLLERPIKEVLKEIKENKVGMSDVLPFSLQKNKKTEDDMIDEINRNGNVICLNEMTIDSIVTTSKTKRLIGGLMNENRMKTITVKLADLFKTLLKFTDKFIVNNEKIETPQYFVKELNNYQKNGLAFLVEREKTYPCGGILADDMGLGKTAQMISLMVHQKNNAKNNQQLEHLRMKKARENGLIPIKTTLIITPLSLMDQWESEIRKFTTSGFLTVYQFHGPKRTNDPHILGQYDVVISSYNTIASEFASTFNNEDEANGKKSKKDILLKSLHAKKVYKTSVLERVCFERVILDEAHTIKNRNSKVSRACTALSSLNRWCVTGTPIHNEMMDAFSLYRFLRCYPIDQEAMWKLYMNSGSAEGPFRLKTLVKATLLRRTKDEISSETGEKLVKLPKKNFKKIELEMAPAERLIYDQMFKAAQKFVKSFLDEFNGKSSENILSNYDSESKNPFLNGGMDDCDGQFRKMACILVYLLRLRQACNHLHLTKAGLDLNCFDAVDEKSAELMKADKSISQSMDESIMSNTTIGDHLEVFKSGYLSSKIKALFERLDKVFNDTNDKVIIISQWTSMFNLIRLHLKKRNISYVEITGEVSQEERQKAQSVINSTSSETRVMFLSLKAGGVGLNLVGANHIFMLDLHWNPFNEDQACDRIYRIGQTKEVFIYKFVCKNTVEKRVLELQDKKRQLSKEFLGETKVRKANHLDNKDLAFIFDC